jgi:hypothetical protein
MAEQDIESIRQQIEAKRVEAGADTSVPYERAEVHAAVGEQIQQAMPTVPPASPPPADAAQPDPALASSVQDLVNIAFTQDLTQAITKAVQTGNPALIDAFHDVLADQLHQELLNRHKVEPAP